MSSGITKGNLLHTAPAVLVNDKSMNPMVDTLADALAKLSASCRMATIYPRIDELPEDLLDILAKDFKVDWYDFNYPVSTKRKVLKDSFFVHRHLGTRAAVEKAISDVWPDSKLEEWFEYGGEPYYFRVVNITAAHVDEDVIRKVLRAIYATKNERSWLEGLNFLREADSTVYVGALPSLHRRYTANPKQAEDADVKATFCMGALPSTHHRIAVSPRFTSMNEARATPRMGGKACLHRKITGGVMNNG